MKYADLYWATGVFVGFVAVMVATAMWVVYEMFR